MPINFPGVPRRERDPGSVWENVDAEHDEYDWTTNGVGPPGPQGPPGATGPSGLQGLPGPPGQTGATGAGLPLDGTTGQILGKQSNADYDYKWLTVPGLADEVIVAHEPNPTAAGLDLWVDLDATLPPAGNLPAGGTTGQSLVKNSPTDFDAGWATVSGGGGGGTTLVPTPIKTANYTAVVNDDVLANTAGGGFTVTLPVTPADGAQVRVRQVNVLVAGAVSVAAGAGDTVDGGTATLSYAYEWVWLQYQASTRIWRNTRGISPAQTPLNAFNQPQSNINMNTFRIIQLGDATAGTDALNRQTADARYALPILAVAPQTANFTATANRLHPVDCTAGDIVATLPTGTADGTRIAFILIGAGTTFELTVNTTSPDRYNIATTGATANVLYNVGDVLQVVYRASAQLWYILVQGQAVLDDTASIYWDNSVQGKLKPQLSRQPTAEVLWLGNAPGLSNQMINRAVLTSARVITTAALTSTYANGAAGSGATLTSTTNVVFPDQDGVTPVLNDFILVNNQTNLPENGLYTLTQQGTGSVPWILTRTAPVDINTGWAGGVWVFVADGVVNSGSLWRTQPRNVTPGTTAIRFTGANRSGGSPADIMWGAARTELRELCDFTEVGSTAVTASAAIPPSGFQVFLAGAGTQLTQVQGTENSRGVAAIETGTTTTGYADIRNIPTAAIMTWDATRRMRLSFRIKTPILSDGTNTFVVRAGMISTLGTTGAMTSGLYWQARSGTNWEAVAMHGSTSNGTSPNGVDTGTTQLTGYRMLSIIYDEVLQQAQFWAGPSVVATVNTNLPVGDPLWVGVQIVKSAGATSRALYVDLIDAHWYDFRNPNYNLP